MGMLTARAQAQFEAAASKRVRYADYEGSDDEETASLIDECA